MDYWGWELVTYFQRKLRCWSVYYKFHRPHNHEQMVFPKRFLWFLLDWLPDTSRKILQTTQWIFDESNCKLTCRFSRDLMVLHGKRNGICGTKNVALRTNHWKFEYIKAYLLTLSFRVIFMQYKSWVTSIVCW